MAKKKNIVKITKEDMEKPFSFVSPFTNKRKVNQRGCFTINGTDPGAVDKWDEAKKTITYLTVEKGRKPELLKELNMLYVNEYSVFPDFDGMSKMIEKHGSLFNWK